MEYVNNSIVPLRLRELNAPDWVLPVIMTTVPSIINFTMNPVISTASDRHRGRWGRRIPFLLFSAPFLAGTLVLMAFSPEIGVWLHALVGPWGGWGIAGVSIFTVGLLMAAFKVFDMFVNTTFWYLFNDVVPQAFMARFMGMFMTLSNAIIIFNLYLNLSLGISMKQFAMLATGIQFMLLIMNYPAGALADRFHPIRVWVWMLSCLLVIVPLNFIWVFTSFTPDQAFHVMIALTAIDLPFSVLLGAVGLPLMMRLLPREQFGQFCSFNALAGALMNILGSLSVAWFMTSMRGIFPDAIWGKDFCYRLIPAWRYPFLLIAMVFLLLLYREWKRQGGESRYAPPGSFTE